MTVPQIPDYASLMSPTLQVLKGLGGSSGIREISDGVIAMLGLTEEQQSIRRSEGDRMTLIDYRLAWARNYLKNIGAITSSTRGVWAITELGETITDSALREAVRQWRSEYGRNYRANRVTADPLPDAEDGDDDLDDGVDWRTTLLNLLLEMSPQAFERLAQRLLREAGFSNVEVLGQPNDGGLDGIGVYRLSLVSFPVFFQCKRYRGSVGAGQVRDFRGAMAGRGEKGLLITTGTFTREARAEAHRDGAPPVELIDGDELCDLLKQYKIGVRTELRTVEDISIVEDDIRSI